MSKEVIEALRKQAGEIAKEGHFGWGNTMTAAADALDTLLAERDRMAIALDEIGGLCRALRQGGPDPMDLEGLSDALEQAVDTAHAALQGEQP